MPNFMPFGTRTVTASGFKFFRTKNFGIQVINKTGSSIAKDKVVAVVGFDVTSGVPKIVLADADNAAGHTDLYVTPNVIADGSQSTVYKGYLSAPNLDTSGVTTVGDPVYLSTTAGAFTATAPTGTDANVFQVGFTKVKSSTLGQIFWDISPILKTGVNQTAGIGYPLGQGGAVTQATNKSTTVALSTKTGQITMNGAALGSVTVVSFTLTNTLIQTGDLLILNHISGGTAGAYGLNAQCGAGSASINVINNSAGSLSEAIVIAFALVKGQVA